MSIIFGPVNSRRFGKSLGVDLSAEYKQCNFDCLYCELKAAKVVNKQDSVVSVDKVIKEIKKALSKEPNIDYLTITANGEPTLYPHLNELIDKINEFKGNIKTLILSNASTIAQKDIQNTLTKFDSVKLSLDCATKRCFKRLDRPSSEIDLGKIKQGMLEFKKIFKGDLLIEILFVEGVNDNLDEVKELNNFLLKLKPSRIDIGTVDRPPAYNIKPISYDKLYELSLAFDKSLNITIATKQNSKAEKFNYSKEQIISTLKRRPLTKNDVEILFSEDSKKNLLSLQKDGKVYIEKVAQVEFLKAKEWEL